MNVLDKIIKNTDIFSSNLISYRNHQDFLSSKLSNAQMRIVKKLSSEVEVYEIVYKSGRYRVKGYIIFPKQNYKKSTLLIYARGGSGEYGGLKLGEVFYDLSVIASMGYFVLTSQYRGNFGGTGKDEIGGGDLQDLISLYEISKKLNISNYKKVTCIGVSRGGQMIYQLAKKVTWIDRAIIVSAPTNLFRSIQLRPDLKKIYNTHFGVSVKNLKNRSVAFWPEMLNKKTKYFVLHGNNDKKVSIQDPFELQHEIDKLDLKLNIEFITIKNREHNISIVDSKIIKILKTPF